MKIHWRAVGFFLGAAGLAAMLTAAFVQLPIASPIRNRYLHAINANVFSQRNVTDSVSAVNFDYRGVDTIGEEFILFVSVMGAMVLLREAQQERKKPLRDAISAGRNVGPSDAMQLWILAMVAPKLLFGIYIITHGQLTPGGGFQGGVILATVVLIIYLGENFEIFKRIMSHPMVEVIEALGAGGFVAIGLLALCWCKPFLTNFLPLGHSHALTSGGTMPLISLAVGLEVAAGFIMVLYAFLQETLSAD
jgi:multicomponent Na+:H+ antiporter subunit B